MHLLRLRYLLVFIALLGISERAFASSPNLLPNPEFKKGPDGAPEGWTFWAPSSELAPVGEVTTRDGASVLSLRARQYASIGKWMTLVQGIRPGQHYRLEVEHQADDVVSEASSVLVIMSWYRSATGEGEIQRDYVLVAGEENGWVRDARTIQAPADAQSVRVEFGFRWAPAGSSVAFKAPRLTEVEPPAPRNVRIVTTRIQPDIPTATVEGNMKLIAEMFDRVGPLKPDVVVFSENIGTRFVKGPLASKAEPIPGPITNLLAEKARKYRTYAIITLLEVDGPLYHNTAVLIDREGRIVGRYRKIHLTMGEGESGLTPGTEYAVYDTDFGRIGVFTCWDNWFSESARALRLKGAEMLFMPLAGDSSTIHWDASWRARAIENGVWFVTSSTVTDSPSRVINPQGEVVAEAISNFAFAVADVDLNQEWRQRYMSVGNGYGEPARFLVKERRPDTYEILQQDALPDPDEVASGAR